MPMKISDLLPSPRNPRTVTRESLGMLKESMDEFGDISGIVFNEFDGTLVGGHQRVQELPPDCEIIIEKEYKPATPSGTIREGYVVSPAGERWAFRVVEWSPEKALAAMVRSNKSAGEWDRPKLVEIIVKLDELNYNLELTGHTHGEIENIVAPLGLPPQHGDPAPTLEENPSTLVHNCPRCGYGFR